MSRAQMHYILDIIEGSILFLLVVSGSIVWFALPEGSEAGKAVVFDRSTWIIAHRWLAVAMLVLFSTHVITHWKWIWYMTRNLSRKPGGD
jgi:hypothetical protein